MTTQTSCGLLSYARCAGGLAVLLVHPGGPYWRAKDEGAWTIPKGLAKPGEDPLAAAKREFKEETNFDAQPPFLALIPLRQRSGKTIQCWAFEGQHDLRQFKSGTFLLEWPPRSGKTVAFPEVDKANFFTLADARRKIAPGQAGFIDELEMRLRA
ncbi:MAG: NUDIX domain-containing protein [Proteobacteria bacterium]|nr:NUDIX domain-containing protein [Pseudomonadota bacterium]